MKEQQLTIGILGGMGTYATIYLFQQYASVFSAEKEWDRPRIVIDNRCTMPSRVRAFLYNEGRDRLLAEMDDSLHHLVDFGCNRIILACNTSHLFLPEIYEKSPELEKFVVNIINSCADRLMRDGIKETYLLGTEGTIESGIYYNVLLERGISCFTPTKEEYHMLRDCIEAVKQNRFSDRIKKDFLELINRNNACILGCTELPILYKKYFSEVVCKKVYDPLKIALTNIHEEFIGGDQL